MDLTWAQLRALYRLTAPAAAPNLAARYNVAPTQDIAIVRATPAGNALATMRWGLVPGWAKDVSIGARLINARAETVAIKPAFRRAFHDRRCIIPASGFYEWRNGASGKQPYYITTADGDPISFAGLWETWRAPDGRPVESATIVTTEANAVLRPLHARMPVILAPEDVQDWLDGAAGVDVLRPCADERLRFWPVGRRVNSVRFDDASLIEPEPEPEPGPEPGPETEPETEETPPQANESPRQGRLF